MFYVYHGNNSDEVRKKAQALIDGLLSKKPDATLVRVTSDSFDKEAIRALTGTQALFVTKLIVVFDTVLREQETQEIILELLPDIAASSNVFIFLENTLLSSVQKRLEKHAEKMIQFSLEKRGTNKTPFNIFALSDALGTRDKRKLWVLHQQGKMGGISTEEMFTILLWGVKTMLMARNAKTAQEAGLNPFVYRKASHYTQKYSEQELVELSSTLVAKYHDARRGGNSLETALELFILSDV